MLQKYLNPTQEQLQTIFNLYELGKFNDVLIKVDVTIKLFPNSDILYNIRGATNAALGRINIANSNYSHAIKLNPDNAGAHNNMANNLKAQGKLEAAIRSYKEAVRIFPRYAQAYYNMGNAFQEKENHTEAIKNYGEALTIKPDFVEAYKNLAHVLKGYHFTKPIYDLNKILTHLIREGNYVSPQDISSSIISILKLDPIIEKAIHKRIETKEYTDFLETISALSELPLLIQLMKSCPIPNLDFELLLSDLREKFLTYLPCIKENQKANNFLLALSLQCFTNEYVYNETEHETDLVNKLIEFIIDKLNSGKQPRKLEILCLSSYRALYKYDWFKRLMLPEDLDEILTRLISEPIEEKQSISSIPSLDKVRNPVSAKVKEQYEENPYPRWINIGLHLNPSTISEVIEDIGYLRLSSSIIKRVDAPEILIAGCGTGQHSIETARRFKKSRVLAIDLSYASLSYAKRKTKELGFQNITYLQADILNLKKLNKKFDIIESSGVLHHTHNPMAAWKALVTCLKPGGIIKIGLYSKMARKNITKIRKEIAKAKLEIKKSEIRKFRKSIIQSDGRHYETILSSKEFYSLSGVRDLLFHYQEHHFTIPQIKRSISDLGLSFCGFENTKIVEIFKSLNSGKNDLYDLNKWNDFEIKYQNAFAGMYQFWCQKV